MENAPLPAKPPAPASDTTQPRPSVGESDFAELVKSRRAELGITAPQPPPTVSTAVSKVVAKLPAPISDAERQAREERRQQERQREIEDTQRRRRDDLWRGLVQARGSRYADCRLENFEHTCDGQRVAVELLKDYAGNISDRLAAGVNVVLIGPAGTGKDHLLMSLCRVAVGSFREVNWQNGTSLWLSFREAIGRDESEATIIKRLTAPDVLAISDPVPPRGPLSDYQAAMLFDVIDSRYSRRRATWVTLNCASRQEAEERIGAQVIDRLSHDALVVKCNWKSYRRSDV